MKKNKDIRIIHIRARKLVLIEGLVIKKYLPSTIMNNVRQSMADQDMCWDDNVIRECTTVIDSGGHISMMHNYDAIRLKGLLLFTYHESPKNDHRFGFPKKGNHLKYYTKGQGY